MAVELITGLMGHGKSLYAVSKYVITCLYHRRVVYHNISGLESKKQGIPAYFPDMDFDAASQCLVEIPEERVKDFYNFIQEYAAERGKKEYSHGCLVIIDEVQNYFGARDFASQANKALIPYLTKHRHWFHDVLFLTQHQDNVDTTIRRLVEQSYLIVNNKDFGSQKSSTVYTYKRDNIGPKLDTGQSIFKYDKRIFSIYDSYEPVKTSKRGVEFKEIKIVNRWWLHPKLIGVSVFLFFVFVWIMFNRESGHDSMLLSGTLYKKKPSSQVSASSASSSRFMPKDSAAPFISPDFSHKVPSAPVSAVPAPVVPPEPDCAIGRKFEGGVIKSLVRGKKWIKADLPSCSGSDWH